MAAWRSLSNGRFLLNGLLVGGALVSGLMQGQGSTAPVIADQTKLATLEKEAGANPDEAQLATLAQGYLDQRQPGLALSLLERPGVPSTARLDQVRATAYLAQGEGFHALELTRAVAERCEVEVCPAWLVAKAARQDAFLTALLEQGVVDPAQDATATAHALAKSQIAVQLVAVR